jgi:hypothetical protein
MKHSTKTTPIPPIKRQPTSPGTLLLYALPILMVVAGVWIALQPPPYTPEITGRPAAQIDRTFFDYGDVAVNTPVTTIFTVRNIGDEPLFILDTPYVQVVEGCCPPTTTISREQIDPGQTAEVRMNFTMHPGMGGEHEFRVHVRTTDPLQPDQEVVVLSNWLE